MTRVVIKAKNGINASPVPGPLTMDAVSAVADTLRNTGLALLDQLPTRQDVLDAAAHVMHITAHRDSDPDGLTVIRDTGQHTGREGFAGLSNGEVLPHTERSSLAAPPRLMMLVCARPATTGGQCLLADSHAVYADLAEHHPDALTALSEPRSAFFGGGDGHLGAVFTPRPDGRPEIRLRWDSLARFSPLAQPYLPVLRAAITRHQQVLTLAASQGYVLDNTRWLHARTAFTGPRLCYRALGEPKDIGP
ncbi:TauD/TfdA family dioxygenase [Streptomyces sp. NPDC052236]|uniref:TauD/TfdA family dioxygenase n=1 Tax=Streptomyces sp. NPDC052236 TaxID=3365686 RepID=UPI0037CDED6A